MNILITGVAGFIGSHLSEKLLSQGHSITGIDNFDPFYSRSVKETNLAQSLSSRNFKLIECGLASIHTMLTGKDSMFDLVIHLAAKAGVRPSIDNPDHYLENNIRGTFLLLEWMKSSGCDKLIFASSSSVYGNNKKIPFSETDPVDRPISPYAFTKKSCELLTFNYHHLFDLSIINLRFFTVYGPRQRPDLAIHKFFERIYNDKPIHIFGDGTSGRDYTFVDDSIQGICSAIDRICSEKKLYEMYNLGNSNPITLGDLVKNIENVIGKKAIRKYLPMQEGDVELTFADITQAKEILGYNPHTTLSQGLFLFKDWFEKQKSAAG